MIRFRFLFHAVLVAMLVGTSVLAWPFESGLGKTARPKPVGKPFPTGATVPTMASFRSELTNWYTKYLGDNYRAHGHHDAKWDAAMEQVHEAWAVRLAGNTSLRYLVDLREKAFYAQSLGCHDPYLEYLLANFTQYLEGDETARPQLELAWRNMKASSYPPTFKCPVLWRYLKLAKAAGKREKELYEELLQEYVELFAQSIAEPTYRNGNQRFHTHLFDGNWSALKYPSRKQIAEKMAALPDADPCLLAYFTGFYYLSAAWDGPKDGPASFAKNMEKAESELIRAWEMQPAFYAAAVGVLMSLDHDETHEDRRLWFDRAIAGQLDCPTAFAKLRWAYQKWRGETEWIYQHGLEAAATNRFDTTAPLQLWRTLRFLQKKCDQGWERMLARDDVVEALISVCDGYAESGVKDFGPGHWRTLKLICCWRSGRYEEAAKELELLGGLPDMVVCCRLNIDVDQLMAETRLFASPWAEEGQRGLGLLAKGKHKEAIPVLRQLMQTCREDAPTIYVYLGSRICDTPFSYVPELADTILDTMIELHRREAVIQSFIRWMKRDQEHVPEAFQDRVAAYLGPICWHLMQEAPTSRIANDEIEEGEVRIDAIQLADIPGAKTLPEMEANDLLATEKALAKLRLQYSYRHRGKGAYGERRAYCKERLYPIVDTIQHWGLLIDFIATNQRRAWRHYRGEKLMGMEDWVHVRGHAGFAYDLYMFSEFGNYVNHHGPGIWDGEAEKLRPELRRLGTIADLEERAQQAWALFQRRGSIQFGFEIEQMLQESGCEVDAARMEHILLKYLTGLNYPWRDVYSVRAMVVGCNAQPGYENRVIGYSKLYWTDYWYVPEIRACQADAALRLDDIDATVEALLDGVQARPGTGWVYVLGERYESPDEAMNAVIQAICEHPDATTDTLNLVERLFPERMAVVHGQ